jgi:hypothetical protein
VKIKTYKNGWTVTMDGPSFPSGMTVVKLYSRDSIVDKMMLDTLQDARALFADWCRLARAA